MKSWAILSTLIFARAILNSATPEIKVVSPSANSCLTADKQLFVIGSVSPAETPLTINGQSVTVWRTGGFLYMATVTTGTNTLAFRAGSTEYRHVFSVSRPPQGWDGKSLCARHPLQALGVHTGETIRLACSAPAGITVHAAVGERNITLAPAPGDPTRFTGQVAFLAPAEEVPVVFYAEGLHDAPAAPLTARSEWPVYQITGPLFETRARSAPGDGETVAFLPSGLRVQGAGFSGPHTRFWLAGTQRFVDARLLTAVANAPLPPRDLPVPDLAASYNIDLSPTNRTPRDILIVLDPGHGGSATGAVGPTGLTEKQANLTQAKIAKAVLEQAGFSVLLTRDADRDLDLYERVRFACNKKADAFISLHYNSCGATGNPRTSRHIASYAWNEFGLNLARAIHPYLASSTPVPDGGVRAASFAVCRNPVIPSCLLELDFITCPEGEEAIQQPDRQRRVADAILAGVRDWLTQPAP